MRILLAAFGLLALIVAVPAPASAEFFGCNDQNSHRTLSYSPRSYSAPARSHYARAYTHEFAAQPTRRAASSRQVYRSYPAGWR